MTSEAIYLPLLPHVETLASGSELRIRGLSAEFNLSFGSAGLARRLGRLLSRGEPFEVLAQPAELSPTELRGMAERLLGEGMLGYASDGLSAKVTAPWSSQPPTKSFGEVVLVGLCQVGLVLLEEVLPLVERLAVADFSRVHRGDVGAFYRRDDVMRSRLEVARSQLKLDYPEVEFLDRRADLLTRLSNSTVCVVCLEMPDLRLLDWVAAKAGGAVLALESTRSGLRAYQQPQRAKTCLTCAAGHRAARDPYAFCLWTQPAGVEVFKWRHRYKEDSVRLAVRRALEFAGDTLHSFGGPSLTSNLSVDPDHRETKAIAPHPECSRCFPQRGDARRIRRDLEESWRLDSNGSAPLTLKDIYLRLSPYCGSTVGFFSDLRQLSLHGKTWDFWRSRGVAPADCAVAQSCAALAGIPAADDRGMRFIQGTGFHPKSLVAAKALAMAECVERACITRFSPAPAFSQTAFSSIQEDSVDPTWFSSYSSAQYETPGFPCVPFTKSSALDWVWALRIHDARPVLIPRDFVRSRSAGAIHLATSNGAACHSRFAKAVLRGAHEVIERDSLMLCWLNVLSPPRISDTDGLLAKVPLARSLVALGFQFTLLNVSSELGVPVIMSIIRDRDDDCLISINVATASTPEGAISKLCREFIQQWRAHFCRPKSLRNVPRAMREPREVRTLQDHLDFYQTPQRHSLLNFLEASEERCPVADLRWNKRAESELPSLVDTLGQAGCEIFAVDCTHPLVAGMGLKVIKVIVSHTQPLHASLANRALGVRRLHRSRLDRRESFPESVPRYNPWPHPFS